MPSHVQFSILRSRCNAVMCADNKGEHRVSRATPLDILDDPRLDIPPPTSAQHLAGSGPSVLGSYLSSSASTRSRPPLFTTAAPVPTNAPSPAPAACSAACPQPAIPHPVPASAQQPTADSRIETPHGLQFPMPRALLESISPDMDGFQAAPHRPAVAHAPTRVGVQS